jgi:hypothetical protein
MVNGESFYDFLSLVFGSADSHTTGRLVRKAALTSEIKLE